MSKEKALPPRENPHLHAHQATLARLLGQREKGRMHHAYLITGAKGIGKATFAYHMARELLADGMVEAAAVEVDAGPSLFGDALEPPATPSAPLSPNDPESPLFRRVAVGSHTDLLVITPAYDAKKGEHKAEIGVDISRKLGEFFSLTPAESRWRVAIIDAADQLNANAANAILKMLEEPPACCVLLLVCHNPAAILPTIRSRCQSVRIAPPNMDDFETIMREQAGAISGLQALYALSGGSPGRAMALHESDAASHYRDFALLLQAASGQPLPASLDGLANPKQRVAWQNFRYMLEVLAHRLYVPSAAHEEIFDGEASCLQALREAHGPELWFAWVQAMRHLLGQTDVFHLDKRTSIRMLLNPQRLVANHAQAA